MGDVVLWAGLSTSCTCEPCVCDAIGAGCEGDAVRTDGKVAELDDAALVRAVASDDVAALRCLYDRHVPWLVARLRARCFDDALVADCDGLGVRHVSTRSRSRPRTPALRSEFWSRLRSATPAQRCRGCRRNCWRWCRPWSSTG